MTQQNRLTTYPLCWPEGWPRKPSYSRSFGKFGERGRLSISASVGRVVAELRLLGVGRDRGGSHDQMARINTARDEGLRVVGA